MEYTELKRRVGKQNPIPPYSKFAVPNEIPIGYSTEILINAGHFVNVDNAYNKLPELPRRATILLRADIVKRLIEVQSKLPKGFSLLVYDGHRTLDFQQNIVDYFYSLNPDLQDGYVSKTTDPNFAPPHTTGGAVDVTLTYNNEVLNLGTPYDSFLPLSHLDALEFTELKEELPSQIRRLLYHSMRAEGFAPYPLEWWHWSYGDQWWAAFYGKDSSIYSTV